MSQCPVLHMRHACSSSCCCLMGLLPAGLPAGLVCPGPRPCGQCPGPGPFPPPHVPQPPRQAGGGVPLVRDRKRAGAAAAVRAGARCSQGQIFRMHRQLTPCSSTCSFSVSNQRGAKQQSAICAEQAGLMLSRSCWHMQLCSLRFGNCLTAMQLLGWSCMAMRA